MLWDRLSSDVSGSTACKVWERDLEAEVSRHALHVTYDWRNMCRPLWRRELILQTDPEDQDPPA